MRDLEDAARPISTRSRDVRARASTSEWGVPSAAFRAQLLGQRTSPYRFRLMCAFALSVLVHALLLRVTFEGQGLGFPSFSLSWKDRRGVLPELRIALVAIPAPIAPPAGAEVANEEEHAAVTGIDPGPALPPASLSRPRDKATTQVALAPSPARAVAKHSADGIADSAQQEVFARAQAGGAVTFPPPIPAVPVIAVEQAVLDTWVVPIEPEAEPIVAPAPSVPDTTLAEVDPERSSDVVVPAQPNVGEREEQGKARQREAARQETERQEAARQESAREESAHQEAARQESVRQEAARQEAVRQEAGRQQSARQEAERHEAARQESARQEAAQQETARQEAARPEAARQEAARQEVARQEAARQEAERQEAARQEAARQDAARQEAARQEAARQEAARQEATRQDAARQEAARQEAARQEAARQEAARQEAARQEAARQQAEPTEVARREAQEAVERRERRLREIGRQLDEEAARRAAASADASRPSLPYSLSSARRYRLFGRWDPNEEIVRYAETWSRRIELNFTTPLWREIVKQPHADPVVIVAVRSDGSVESVTFVRSSGVPAIDDVVRQIVDSQKPYPEFPPSLARDYDVIEIRRRWHFDSAVRLD